LKKVKKLIALLCESISLNTTWAFCFSTFQSFDKASLNFNSYLTGVSLEVVSVPPSPGVLVRTGQTAREAERELVRRSGKETDGIYAKVNRWLCRPAVRWLSKTSITPNIVSFAGLAVALVSGYLFAQGYWRAYVLGALLYFLSVLFDEIDGMLARLTFRESAFGCWLETFVDYASYILLFAGMTIGLYRQGGAPWLALGGLLLIGTLLSFFVVSHQRKLATDPDKPNEYLRRIHRRLEADSGDFFSRFGRHTEFVMRKAAFGYWVLIFSLLGGLKVFFLMAAFGSNIVWPVALSFNRLFRRPPLATQPEKSCRQPFCSGVEEGR
jgi:phosphatidylglycerophosphate synthase